MILPAGPTRRDVLGAAAAAFVPNKMTDLCFTPATELAKMLRAKKLSSRELLDACLKRIERVNPRVNSIVTLIVEQARERAKQADEEAAKGVFLGPLHGLPIAHKDLVDTKGIRTTYGSPIFRNNVPAGDALLVERIRAAGAVLVGKTNTPEFGAGSQTFNKVFGATRNPFDLSKTCGGSSGGAAVSLATGMLPIADGSDMGGSLRNPAAFCSVVGFRTSPGRVPIVPSTSPWQSLSVAGPMARNVGDVALLLSTIAGPDPRAALSLDDPGSRFAMPLERSVKGLRVAWCPSLTGALFEKRISDVFGRHRKTFESMGCVVEEAQPDLTGVDEIFRTYRAASYYKGYGALLTQHRGEIKDTVIEEIEKGARLSLSDMNRAETLWGALLERVGVFMSKYDFLVLPTTQVAPFSVDTPYPTSIDGTKLSSYIDWMRSCYYITVTTLPSISMPGGFTPEGLPVGIQIVGRRHADFSVLQMARAFEQAAPIANRLPDSLFANDK